MELSSSRAMTIRRIEGGIFGNLTDIDTTMTPFEASKGVIVVSISVKFPNIPPSILLIVIARDDDSSIP